VGGVIVAALGSFLAVAAPADPPILTLLASNASVGQAIHATAQLSESPGAEGEISFEVFAPDDPTCTGPALTPAPTSATVNGEGQYPSGDFTTAGAGTYSWSAHYTGDLVNPPADATCAALSTVSKATPTLTGTASAAVVGGAIHDEVSVTGGFTPTGEVTFTVYGPGDTSCATPLETSTVAIQSAHATSADFTSPQAGGFRWTASYPGDENNEAAILACNAANQTSTVGKASPTLSGVATTAVAVGQTITDNATLASGFSPGGHLVIRAYGPADSTCVTTPKYEATVAVSGNGPYSPAGFAPAPGAYRWTVEYAGDGNNAVVSLGCNAANQSSAVSKASPTLTGSASAAVVGKAIHDEVSLTGGFSPGGEVSFSVFAPTDTTCATPLATSTVAIQSAHATSADFTSPQAGGFRWTASYPGDTNNEAVSLGCNAANQTSTVSKASPTLTGVATTAVTVGQTITDTATLAAGFSPSGNLLFRAYGPSDATCATTPQYETTVAASGNGPYSPAGFAPAPGAYRWTVKYAGDANNEAFSLGCNAANQSSAVSKATPALTGSASAAVVGKAIHDEVSLTGGFTPTGEVTFSVYAPSDTLCATPLETSSALIQSAHATSADFTSPQAGGFRWTASYPGDANNEAVSLGCNAANQTSAVGKASPTLTAVATAFAEVGQTITDTATLAAGFNPSGNLRFRAYGPNDATCAAPPKHDVTVTASGNGPYSPASFTPARGLYRWTVDYAGDANNEAFSLGCNAANQSSLVGMVDVALTASATSTTIGNPVTATATINEGANPTGQVTFKAFPSSDVNCSGAAIFSSIVAAAGNGSYRSAPFLPTRVDNLRWAIAYSGDAHNTPAAVICGNAISAIAQAKPSIAGAVAQRVFVGAPFRDTATLQGGYAPGGTVTFRIYGPDAAGCATPLLVDIVAVRDNGVVSSDPFTPQRPGRYSFLASYSGDATNQAATEACDSAGQVTQVRKHTPRVKPRAQLIGRKTISIRARLSGGASPSGSISFRLYRPGDDHCARRPAFSGAISVKANGDYSLARYLATKRGIYRLSVSYSGDQRNQRYKGTCGRAQPIRVG
jgi:uncharacterized protein YfaP (DUF2135 family)